MNKPEEYLGIPSAQKLLELYEEANGRPAESLEDLIKWMMSAFGRAAIAYDSGT
jgi:hypothetical protein